MSFKSDGTLTCSVHEKGLMGSIREAVNVVTGDMRGTWTINDEVLTYRLHGVSDSAANAFIQVVFALSDAFGSKSLFNEPCSARIAKMEGGTLTFLNGRVWTKIQ